ncbi:MAG: hypothetical protein CMO80_24965 [Verrucomicrobiales bacterium]|mgnify:CR=1 FL=1|nr:hypothetical protein [Verrucomicrobiales bacterium]|tara:strand:+ start:370 stop:1176 length:807 start_codon:yes stop_codon:yes gene_type:complete
MSLIGRYFAFVARSCAYIKDTVRSVGAFALITLGVTFTKFGESRQVIWPLIRKQIARAGVRLLPASIFLGSVLGLAIIGQMVSLLTRVGAIDVIGKVMETVVVRELGPLAAALMVLGRVGTATVIELGTKRAQGEVEALEALGIDPVHYLVVPRVVGLAFSIFSLTVYLIITVIVSGFLFAFLTDVPIEPEVYFGQIVDNISYQDFIFLAIKTLLFGTIIAVVTCYHGLAQPIRLEHVSIAANHAVSQSVIACLLLNAVFVVSYIVTS